MAKHNSRDTKKISKESWELEQAAKTISKLIGKEVRDHQVSKAIDEHGNDRAFIYAYFKSIAHTL